MARKKKEQPNLNLPVPIGKREESIFADPAFSTTVTGTETLEPASTAVVKDDRVIATPDPIYEAVARVKEQKALPGITVGADIKLEPLSGLEEEIYKVLSDGRVHSVKGIRSKLKDEFAQATEEEVEKAVTDLISQGLIVETSTGKFQVVAEEDFQVNEEGTSKGKRRTGKAGKTFRNIFARTKMTGSDLMGKIKSKGTKAGKTVGGIGVGVGAGAGRFVGSKAPYIGGEARERRAEEEAFFEGQFTSGTSDSSIPPSMRKKARKTFKTGFKEELRTQEEARDAGIDPYTIEGGNVWNEKKKKFERSPIGTRRKKTTSEIRQELLDLRIQTKRKEGAINVAEFGRRESKKLVPGRIRGGLETAGKVGVIASKGGIGLAKQFGNAPRLSRVTGLTGSDSPITYEGSGASRLRAATIGARPLGTTRPQSFSGRGPIQPFGSRERISPGGGPIPLFKTPRERLMGTSRRGPGQVRRRPLF